MRCGKALAVIVIHVSLLFVCATTPIAFAQGQTVAEVNNINLQRVKPFIRNINAIRVFIGESPAMGHQTNSFNIMNYLRKIGLSGRFEVVYDDAKVPERQNVDHTPGTPEKLAYLLPGFRADVRDVQEFENGKMVMIPYSLFKEDQDRWPRVELGLTGGQDFYKMSAVDLRTIVYLDLYPTGFQGLHWETIDLSEPKITTTLMEVLGSDFIHYEIPVTIGLELNSIRSKLMGHSKKHDEVIKLLERNDSIDLMPVYGMKGYSNLGSGYAISQFLNLVAAVKEVAADRSKPASLLVLDHLEHHEKQKLLEKLKNEYPDVSVIDLTQPSDAQASAPIVLSEGQVTVQIVGGLPPLLFNHLLATSHLPPIGGGANFLETMKQLHRPFLHTQSDFKVESPPEDWVSSRIAGLAILKPDWAGEVWKISSVRRELVSGKSRDHLVSFIRACVNNDYRLQEIFRYGQRGLPNKILSAVSYAISHLVHFNHIQEPTEKLATEPKGRLALNLCKQAVSSQP